MNIHNIISWHFYIILHIQLKSSMIFLSLKNHFKFCLRKHFKLFLIEYLGLYIYQYLRLIMA